MINIPMTQFQRWVTMLLLAAVLAVLATFKIIGWEVFLGFILAGATPSPIIRTGKKNADNQ